jgi:NitT/TauT family transport system substrate-binding protein
MTFAKLMCRGLAGALTGAVLSYAAAGAADAGQMRLGMTTWVGYGPMFLARDKGFFKENGLDVDLQIIEDGAV